MAKELADMPDDEARARYQEDLARAAVMEQSGTASRNEAAVSRNESLPTDKQPPAGAQWEEQQLLPSASPHTTAPSHTESPSTTARPVVQVLQDATPVSTTHGSSTVQQKKQQHAEPASPSANAQHALEQRNAELTRMLEIIKQKAKSKIQELSTTVQTLTEENRQLKEYSSAVELQGAGAEELAKIQALTSENESLRVQLVASSMLQQTVDDVQEQLSQREATIAQLQSQMEATASANANERAQLEEAIAEAVDAAVADKDAELERLRHDYEQRLLASQATAEEELRVMREQVAAKTSAMDTGFVDDVGEENSQDNSIATLQSQLATVTAERDELQRQAVVASRVPELEKALDDNRRLLAGSKTIVDKLKAEVIRLRALAADGGSPRPPLSPGASDEVASLRQQLQRKDAELHQKATQLTAFKESLEAAEQARAELQQQVAESHRDTSATELQNQLDVANESLNQALADVSSLEEKNSALQMQITDANAGQHLKQELDAAQSALTTATERASTAERTAAELQSQLDDLQEQLNQREQQLIAQVSSSTDSDAHQKRIAELESELSTVASQLEAERERSTSAETSVVEKQEMIAALERQIAGLHKATMLVRTKDQELQVMRESLTTVEQRLAAATQSAADMEVAKVEGDAATAMLQRKVDDLHLRIEAQRQASDEEIARVRAYTQELEEKLVQAESIAVQASSNESELKAHVAEAEQLRAELASANDRLAAFDAAQQSHSETSQLARDLEEQNRVRALRMEKLSAELDSVRAELHAKVETMEAQRLEFDRLKEENATMASDVEGRVGEANQLLQERTHEGNWRPHDVGILISLTQ